MPPLAWTDIGNWMRDVFLKMLIPGVGTVVTPNDETDLPDVPESGVTLYVGTQGDLKVDLAEGGTELIFKNIQGNFPYRVKKVYSSGTSASDIIAAYEENE